VLEDDDVRRRFRSVDDRIEATRAQIDNLRLELSRQIEETCRALVRLVVRGVLVSTLVVGIMCLLTLVVLL
jgi:integral membrane sensor domain MASE1